MRKQFSIGLVLIACLGATGPAMSAAYMKLGDIKGEAAESKPTTPSEVKKGARKGEAGMLVPAVQKVRDPAANTRKKGNVEYEWKVEEGK